MIINYMCVYIVIIADYFITCILFSIIQVSHKHLGAPIEGKFKLNYCSGHCMIPMNGNPPLHTIIMGHLAFTMDTDISNVTPVPCCVPTKYSSLTVFLYEASPFPHFVLRILTNMTAKECGCR